MKVSSPVETRSSTARSEFIAVCAFSVLVFLLAGAMELNERVLRSLTPFEHLQFDELPFALLAMSLGLTWFAWRRWVETRRELQRRQIVETALERSRTELRELSHQSMQQQEDERRSLARELHDEMGQTLNAIKIEAVGIRNFINQPAGAPGLESLADIRRAANSIIAQTDHVYGVVRQINSRLRPVALDELGLAAALENCVDGWRERLPDTRFDFQCDGTLDQLNEAQAVALYRVVQECLTNAIRHGQASLISIDLRLSPDPAEVILVVGDDGKGVDLAIATQGFGLIGMRERIESLGGVVELVSSEQSGFRVRVALPLKSGQGS